MLLADQGTIKDLHAALETTARQTRQLHDEGATLVGDTLITGGPFPQRMHLIERILVFYGEFLFLLIRWCDETLAEVESWPSTCDVGLTPQARERLEQLHARGREDL